MRKQGHEGWMLGWQEWIGDNNVGVNRNEETGT